ncbi:MAG: hypothetical protein KGL39_30620 [Patescibacteria group bacterium]|nr:hypothetical protein [Patescibacteria group bacterium]
MANLGDWMLMKNITATPLNDDGIFAARIDDIRARFHAKQDGTMRCRGCGAVVSSMGAAARHMKACKGMIGAKLTTKARKHVATKNFGLPEQRKYPMPDLAHARNALARAAQSATPEEQAKIRRKAYKLFPALKKRAIKRGAIKSDGLGSPTPSTMVDRGM